MQICSSSKAEQQLEGVQGGGGGRNGELKKNFPQFSDPLTPIRCGWLRPQLRQVHESVA